MIRFVDFILFDFFMAFVYRLVIECKIKKISAKDGTYLEVFAYLCLNINKNRKNINKNKRKQI